MKNLQVCEGYHRINYGFLDHAKAEAAYNAVKEAMAKHREFGNDDARTVSVATDSGEVTFRISTVTSVVLEDGDGEHVAAFYRARAAREKMAQDIEEEFGLTQKAAAK